MKQFFAPAALIVWLGACGPSADEVFQKNLKEKWIALSVIYADGDGPALKELHSEITSNIEDRIRRNVLQGESKLSVMQANYFSSSNLYSYGGGAGLMAQFDAEEKIRDAKVAILQTQIVGQKEKLVLNNARIEMLKNQRDLSPACKEKAIPTTASKVQHVDCSLAFQQVANSQIAYLSKIQSLGLGGPQTAAIKTKIAKLALDEKRAVRVYNDMITKHPKEAKQASAVLLKVTPNQIELSTTRRENPVSAEANTAPKKKWQCDGWYTNVQFSEESGDGSGVDLRIANGELTTFNSWEGGVFEGNPTNSTIDGSRLKAKIEFAEFPDQDASDVSLTCANGKLQFASSSWTSGALRKGKAEP